MVARIDEETLHLPDLTIQGMNVVTGLQLYLTHRDDLLDDGPLGPRYPRVNRAGRRGCLHVCPFPHFSVLGGIEIAELGDGTAQPDLAVRGVDKVHRDQPTELLPVLGPDDKVGDPTGSRIENDAAHLAARAIRAACLRPDRELCLLGHCRLPFPGYPASSVVRTSGAKRAHLLTSYCPSRAFSAASQSAPHDCHAAP